jgi:hypothetical protein
MSIVIPPRASRPPVAPGAHGTPVARLWLWGLAALFAAALAWGVMIGLRLRPTPTPLPAATGTRAADAPAAADVSSILLTPPPPSVTAQRPPAPGPSSEESLQALRSQTAAIRAAELESMRRQMRENDRLPVEQQRRLAPTREMIESLQREPNVILQ